MDKPDEDERGSIEFTAPGFGAKVRGAAWGSREILFVVVIISCTAFLYFERIQSNKGFVDQHAVTQAQNLVTQSMLATLIKGQTELGKGMSESAEIQAYVLSLPPAQREKLNLSMPATLRARIRSNTQ